MEDGADDGNARGHSPSGHPGPAGSGREDGSTAASACRETHLQVALPFLAFAAPNILRIVVPYLSGTPTGRDGLGDVSVFDIVIVPAGPLKLAIGAVASSRKCILTAGVALIAR